MDTFKCWSDGHETDIKKKKSTVILIMLASAFRCLKC